MKQTLLKRCQMFVANRDAVKAAFPMESSYLYPVCAEIITENNVVADHQRLKACRAVLKENTGAFSSFRGYAMLATVSMMAVSDDPKERLLRSTDAYEKLREKFSSSSYLPLAATVIANGAKRENFGEICSRIRKIYDLLRSEHPFLTSSEDVVFSALLAMSGLSERQIIDDTERCYKTLKETFISSNAVQSLSHVLALFEGSARSKCQEVTDLFNELKDVGHRFGTNYELATLGVLAMQKREHSDIVSDLLDVDAYLAQCKGYKGIFGLPKKTRLMHAALIVSGAMSCDQTVMNASALGGTVSMIIAQQAAMCAAIAATVAASSSD